MKEDCKCKTERHQGNILKLDYPVLKCQKCGAKYKTRGYAALKGHRIVEIPPWRDNSDGA